MPNREKAINIACLYNDLYYVLGETGRVFKINKFVNEVQKLSKYEIIFISGTCDFCLAVSRDGLVFKLDYNSKVEVISSLNKYKIVKAYAGYSHSLFQTKEGMILSCGTNQFGELVLDKTSRGCEFPTETIVKSGASFCIAGRNLSAIIIGPTIPAYMANMNVTFEKRPSSAMLPKLPKDNEMHDEIIESKDEIDERDQEIMKLLETIESLKKQKEQQKSK